MPAPTAVPFTVDAAQGRRLAGCLAYLLGSDAEKESREKIKQQKQHAAASWREGFIPRAAGADHDVYNFVRSAADDRQILHDALKEGVPRATAIVFLIELLTFQPYGSLGMAINSRVRDAVVDDIGAWMGLETAKVAEVHRVVQSAVRSQRGLDWSKLAFFHLGGGSAGHTAGMATPALAAVLRDAGAGVLGSQGLVAETGLAGGYTLLVAAERARQLCLGGRDGALSARGRAQLEAEIVKFQAAFATVLLDRQAVDFAAARQAVEAEFALILDLEERLEREVRRASDLPTRSRRELLKNGEALVQALDNALAFQRRHLQEAFGAG